ncbi:MAG TPA: hypothetical protein VNA69_09235 [Thermoanaerobaculia bacterium]|nr:hypothetical protein [Thermoanaerobaculia bacterium]
MTGVARLRYGPADFMGDGIRVTSRTYNVNEGGGTYGTLIPPLNSFQSAANGERLEILGVIGGTGFRTNVGLVDLSPAFDGQTADARIYLYDDRGTLLDQFPIQIATAGGTQINDIFGSRGIPQPKAALIVIEVSKGLIGAYATLTDNVTNDSSYLGANLAAQPN